MRAIFFGSDRKTSLECLAYLKQHADVVATVGVPGATHTPDNLPDSDILLSVKYPKKITVKHPCAINFHAAPLPELRGLFCLNYAIFSGMNYYGVSAHFIDDDYDTGNIILVDRFHIDPDKETALSLSRRTDIALVDLFKYIIDLVNDMKPLTWHKQKREEGKYISRAWFEAIRQVRPYHHSAKDVERRIRACYYPPHPGAYIVIDGKEFLLALNNQNSESPA